MRTRKRRGSKERRAIPAIVLAGVAALAAACSSPSAGSHATTTTTSAAPKASLPTPIVVDGTSEDGTLAFLGSVMRVAVEPVPDGATLPPAPAPTTTLAGVATSTTEPASRVTIGYRQLGSGSDLVLVMGQDGSMTWWYPPLLLDLSQHFRVTIFDLPGVGYSAADTASPSVSRYADVTAGLIDALGLSHPVVVGWGMGGEVALELAIRHAGLASRLVLADTSAGGSGSVPTGSAVSALLASPATTDTRFGSLIFPVYAAAARTAWLQQDVAQTPDDVVAAAIGQEATAQASWWRSGASQAQLASVGIPVLLVDGSVDPLFSADDTNQLAVDLPEAREVTFPNDGYAALFQDDTAFSSDVVSFASS